MSLRSLSNSQILSRLQDLVGRERQATLLVLLHLNEVERRKLHLKLGYSSLFDYCTTKLGYSASAAVRRIKSARCVVRFPWVYELLKENEVNLSTIAQVADALTDSNHAELLGRIRGRSQREVEAILAEYQPCSKPRERVRTIVVRVPGPPVDMFRKGDGAQQSKDCAPSLAIVATPEVPVRPAVCSNACENNDYNRNGCEPVVTTPREAAAGTASTEKRVMLQFSVRPEFMEKVEKTKALAWHRLPRNASLEDVFEYAMDLVIAREDPAKRIERREQREEKRTEKKRTEKKSEVRHSTANSNRRHIPQSVRDQVFMRDGHRCTFVGADGHRCNAMRALQVDHVRPVARGGASTSENLRVLCAYHNRLEAERLLGSCAGRTQLRSSPSRFAT